MTPQDHQLLELARQHAPIQGVRVTARRGVWRKPGGPWRRFEDTVTVTGYVRQLDDQEVRIARGALCTAVLLGDIDHVTDDVPLSELARNPTVQEALSLIQDGTAA